MDKDFPLDIEVLIDRISKQMLAKDVPLKEACEGFEKRLANLILEKVGGSESKATRLFEIRK